MRSTAELVVEVQSEDRAAFAELVGRYQRAVVSTAWSVLNDYHIAQDVAQDSFLLAYRQIGSLRDASSFGPWLLTLTRREAVRRTRQGPMTVSIDSVAETAAPTLTPVWNERFEDLVKAVGRLPEHEQEVVMFHYLDTYSVSQVAELTGRPIGTVTKQLSRAVDRLRRLVTEVQT